MVRHLTKWKRNYAAVAVIGAAGAAMWLSVSAGDGTAAQPVPSTRLMTPSVALLAGIPSHDGIFRASMVPSPQPITSGRSLAWIVEVRMAGGAPVDGAALALESWMPDDERVAATRPRVAAGLGAGRYRIEGLRFDRAGWWNVKLRVAATDGTDSLAFNLVLAEWAASELVTLRSLSIGSLEPLRADPSNRYGDDPRAASLGHKLFFDARLSSNGKVACSTCHLPAKQFQDGTPLATGVGTTDRRTMPIAGTAHGAWLFWDGRKDSQWSQALGPLESPVEHGGDRTQYAHLMAASYRAEYEAIFGRLPSLAGLPRRAGPVADAGRAAAWRRIPATRREDVSRIYANIGKAIAAYERQLEPGPSRFDRYVEVASGHRAPTPESSLSAEELAGLRLFIGKGNCTDCHNGPRFTDDHFHNTGVPSVPALPKDLGRAAGARQVLADEFNCLGRYSDARPEQCEELRFVVAEGEELVRAYRTPSLRNVAERAPYMHAGQLATLEEVVRHYDRAPAPPAGHTELKPLHLSDTERSQLEAFLRTLSGPIAAPATLLAAPAGD